MKKHIFPAFAVIAILLIGSLGLLFACKDTSNPKPKLVEYEVKIDPNIQNGYVSAAPSKAKAQATITMSADPDDDYIFVKFIVWKSTDTSDIVYEGTGNTFKMPAFDVFVSAEFILEGGAAVEYTVAIDPGIDGGTLTVSKNKAEEGETITMNPIPDADYTFDRFKVWKSGDPSTVVYEGTANSFEMPAFAVVVSVFFLHDDAPVYTVNIDSAITGGTISVSPSSAKAGQNITITATPASIDYVLEKFIVWDNDDKGGVPYYEGIVNKFDMPSFDVFVSAVFLQDLAQEYTVTIDPNMEFGWMYFSPAKPKERSTVTLTAEPDWGYMVDLKPVVTGESSGDIMEVTIEGKENTFSFTMPSENVIVTASFLPANTPSFDITLDYGPGGTIEVNRDSAYEGNDIIITIIPDAGFLLDSISAAGSLGASPALSGSGDTRSFKMPAENVTITVSFYDPNFEYDINIGTISNGSITSNVPAAKPGVTVTLTATPGAGYRFLSITVTKAGGGTVATAAAGTNQYSFEMPIDDVTVTAAFELIPSLTFPLSIDPMTANIDSYTYTGNWEPGWSKETVPRVHLYAKLEPQGNPTRFGRSGNLNVVMTEYINDPSTCVILDIAVEATPPYVYTFSLEVNGTDYGAEVRSVTPAAILHAIPLSQMKSATNVALTSLTGTLTVTGWNIYCTNTSGLTDTRVFGISLNQVQIRNLAKGTVTGPAGCDITLPAITEVPAGNRVPVDLSISAGNQFVGLNYAPSQPGIVEGDVSAVLVYFVMPNADISVGAEYEAIPTPPVWVIEEFAGISGSPGWYSDYAKDGGPTGFWGINCSYNYQNNTNTGPHWLTNGTGPAAQGSDYSTIMTAGSTNWIMQISAQSTLAVGRNILIPLNISDKDTVRLLIRRSNAITLEFGLFNGGQAGASYGHNNNQGSAVTGESIDVSKSGTGYWTALPLNSNGAWVTVEIPVSNFTSQGFNAAQLTGWGIRVTSTHNPTTGWWTNPKFYLQKIEAFNK